MHVAPVTEEQFEAVLPLIADYQRFYGSDPDPVRNAAFFRRFLEPSDEGLLLGAWEQGELLGHACLYWTFSSVSAEEVVLLNDLFVREQHRGSGVGRTLIDATVDVARAPLTLDRLKIGPTTTHYTVAPELLNRDEIVNLLNQRYPNELRMLGRGGLTTLWLLIDQDGNARKALVFASSGHEGFDAAALDAVSVMKFSPAQNNGRTTPVWVQLPVRFQVARTY